MDTKQTLDGYSELMTAVGSRHNILLDVVANPRGYPDWAVIEQAQLQIRLICETIALSCLLAHGDVPGTRSSKLLSAYRADYIIRALERLHPSFYPRPTERVVDDGKVVGWKHSDAKHLTKDNLLASYWVADEILHAGDLRDVIAKREKQLDSAVLLTWAEELWALISNHNIYLADPPDTPPSLACDPLRQITCSFRPHRDGGIVARTFLFQRLDATP